MDFKPKRADADSRMKNRKRVVWHAEITTRVRQSGPIGAERLKKLLQDQRET